MGKPIIKINPKKFNKLYYKIKKSIKNTSIRFIWIYGGSSSSKTYSFVQVQIAFMLMAKDENALVLRKYATDIKDSIFADFKNVISDYKLDHLFTIQQNFIMCNSTGSFVRFRGLDDSEKVKGISSFKRVVMEEITQFDEIDFKQVKKRLRGKEGQQIICIFNPISEEHWIKKNVFDNEELTELESDIAGTWINANGDTIIFKTNYLDNKYIVGEYDEQGNLIAGFRDVHTINDFEKDKVSDYNYYLIYALGNWGKLRTGGEFWKDFDTNKHCGNTEYNPNLPIHLSWDENVNPYLTCTVWQISGKNIYQIDEICLPDPNNRVANVCREFKKRYPNVNGLFIYGDRTSVKEDTKLEKGENFFTLIMQNLKEYHPKLRLMSSNPSVVMSGLFINKIYAENFLGLNILINHKCKKSINDYNYAVEDSDGTLKKKKVINKETKVSYEEFGHVSDTKRYIITTAFQAEYNEFLRGGKKTETRIGRASSKSGY